ncbi:MAG TPA: hypothetical protein VL295_05560 [Gemmatimonadales bacterium]|nr:hypothetical protein [Gemmatimonadales bacterium]
MNTRPTSRTASLDPTLAAVVVAQQPLFYAEGADPALDRPAHVRAGSSLAWVPGGIAVLQDDANFLAIVDPASAAVRSITLPAGEGGIRQFDQSLGNKKTKLDLEACVAIEHQGATMLVAFGSGSTHRREQILVVRDLTSERPDARLLYAEGLYALLRSATGFAPGRLNIEGAVVLGDTLRLFSRGNGKIRNGERPVNATCDLPLGELVSYFFQQARNPPPSPTEIVTYELGALGQVPLSFTDAAAWKDGVLFTAAAEASPDAVDDGPVTGSAVGVIDGAGNARWAPVVDLTGEPYTGKVEGLVVGQEKGRLYVVVDADDPKAASVLCTVELRGV